MQNLHTPTMNNRQSLHDLQIELLCAPGILYLVYIVRYRTNVEYTL